jgi:DNA polymerase-3 subunit delta'
MSEIGADPALLGQTLLHLDAQARAFDEAKARGRLHHAWMFTGPQGLGKAALAHRLARRLLGAAPDLGGGVAGTRGDDHVNRMVEAHAHPDFILLDRTGEDGKPRKTISVDDARQLPEFFSKAPALARHRVAIIDAAEDMNANAANAVLKTLEEPPPNGVIFLISHAPGRLLPTIRSRCRTLSFRPWPEEDLADLLERRLGLDRADAQARAALAGGSPGRALALADGEAVRIDEAARALLAGAPTRNDPVLVNLADGFRGGQGLERFSLFIERLADRIGRKVREDDGLSPASRAAWAEVFDLLVALPPEAEGINLDRADALVAVWSRIADTARRHPVF